MLDSLLEKLKIKSPDELTTAERETYQQWSQILAKADVTIEDLKKLLLRTQAEAFFIRIDTFKAVLL